MVSKAAKTAFLWDKSFLWGIIAFQTFKELDISFDLVTASDIRAGALSAYDIIFVPGGWASDKIIALGDDGRSRIRDFVAAGGAYLGICGGAGLALSHESGLALAPLSRMPTSARVPSFSGRINLRQTAQQHPMWRNIAEDSAFYAWWPGQFALDGATDVTVLARYGEPGDDSFVTDLPVLPQVDWDAMEKSYGINLDPSRLTGEPAVLENRFGEGVVFLSYLHFETPGDNAGHVVLLNILTHLARGKQVKSSQDGRPGPGTTSHYSQRADAGISAMVGDLDRAAQDLIAFGKNNYLWSERNDWILQWRRGVRGVEYSTLNAMIRAIAEDSHLMDESDRRSVNDLERLRELALVFFNDAKELLRLERDAIASGPISPLKTDDPRIGALRERLFSKSKRCGGLYEEIVELMDKILLPLLKEELRQNHR
ncbi:MAG: BPL-N domain-containing protein [Thermoleophilia bacterium]|jgi:putative intracellular protease/amidase